VIDSPVSAEVAEGSQVTVTGGGGAVIVASVQAVGSDERTHDETVTDAVLTPIVL
jgi:hypothetical protein